MLRVDVEIKGDKGEFTLDALKFSNEGTSFSTDIASARVYCTDTVSVFMNTNQYGETLKNCLISLTETTRLLYPVSINSGWFMIYPEMP